MKYAKLLCQVEKKLVLKYPIMMIKYSQMIFALIKIELCHTFKIIDLS